MAQRVAKVEHLGPKRQKVAKAIYHFMEVMQEGPSKLDPIDELDPKDEQGLVDITEAVISLWLALKAI